MLTLAYTEGVNVVMPESDPVEIYPVVIGGDGWATDFNAALAEESGGKMFTAANAEEVVETILTVLDNLEGPTLAADIVLNPDVLNKNSKGKYLTAYIELPEGFTASQIDAASVLLNGVVPAITDLSYVGDHDSDGTPDLCVKFSRGEVSTLFYTGKQTLLIEGRLMSGESFSGTDSLLFTLPGRSGEEIHN